ncbi:MAG: endolytic transglycosylase MltG [Chloroflexi bacterium]|nr:endolytic transglycosylase MltG [Chloroflexota bacterium]
MKRFIRDLIAVMVIIGFLAAVCGAAVLILAGDQLADLVQDGLARLTVSARADELNRGVGSDDAPVRFVVNLGDTPRLIARSLLDSGLISDDDLFLSYVRANRLDTELEAGTYFLNRTMSIPQIASVLIDSAASQFPFRILEGWRIEEVADQIDANPVYFDFSGADFLAAVGPGAVVAAGFREFVGLPDGASLEGFLYPDTYQLPAGVTVVQLRDILLQTFLQRVGTQLPHDAQEQGLTLYQIVTLASIVEREALHDDEHVLIASAYRNRLDIGMKLDADPTVQYALNGARGRWWPQITLADYVNISSPYNTYLNTGLPPGPIASPGISAIRAAVYPAESNYLYFRARCDGSGYHDFAVTYDEHLANGC